MFLMIDNYDSFVYNLVRYLEELGEEVVVKRNDEIDIKFIKELKPEGIVISPGPKSPKDVDSCLRVIDEFKESIPILGICLGHQCIGHYFGGNIVRGDFPMHGKVSKVNHNGQGIFNGLIESFNVTRYHSLVISKDNFPDTLYITCESNDGVIMGIRHKEYKIEGVQFHPEAELTEFGHEILRNFILNCRKGD